MAVAAATHRTGGLHPPRHHPHHPSLMEMELMAAAAMHEQHHHQQQQQQQRVAMQYLLSTMHRNNNNNASGPYSAALSDRMPSPDHASLVANIGVHPPPPPSIPIGMVPSLPPRMGPYSLVLSTNTVNNCNDDVDGHHGWSAEGREAVMLLPAEKRKRVKVRQNKDPDSEDPPKSRPLKKAKGSTATGKGGDFGSIPDATIVPSADKEVVPTAEGNAFIRTTLATATAPSTEVPPTEHSDSKSESKPPSSTKENATTTTQNKSPTSTASPKPTVSYPTITVHHKLGTTISSTTTTTPSRKVPHSSSSASPSSAKKTPGSSVTKGSSPSFSFPFPYLHTGLHPTLNDPVPHLQTLNTPPWTLS